MAEVIGVRFKNTGKVYYFDPQGIQVEKGSMAIVETARGLECGEVALANREVADESIVQPLRRLIRLATPEDLKKVAENHIKEKKAFRACEKKIAERGLEMKLVDVEYTFDNSKILFYFTADGRVDFRELVKDLAGMFRTRIELRQIGVRDEAKMLGGMGICGRPFCCGSFLGGFTPVSIKMAKEQGLSLNPVKISGACGRLMCCLKYEQEAYEDVLKRTPKLESLGETPDGVGTVNSVQLLREKVKVRLDDDPENPRVYSNADITVIRSGKGKRPEGYELPDPAERAQRQAAHLRDARVKTPAPAAPAAPAQEPRGGQAASGEGKAGGGEKEKSARRRHRSHRRGSSGPRPAGEAQAPQQQPKAAAPQGAGQAQQGPGEGAGKSRPRRHRSRLRSGGYKGAGGRASKPQE